MDGGGNAVFVWGSGASAGSDTSSYSVQARRFDATRMPLASQFQVNTYTTSRSGESRASRCEAVVNSSSCGRAPAAPGPMIALSIQAQRFDASGTAAGPEFQVNAYTSGTSARPAVAVDGGGKLRRRWVSNGSTGTDDIRHQHPGPPIRRSGSPLGGQFQVNTYTTSVQGSPDVAADDAGNILVVWTSSGSTGSDTSGASVQAQGYDGSGCPTAASSRSTRTRQVTRGDRRSRRRRAGAFVVTWLGEGRFDVDVPATSIQAQRIVEGSTRTLRRARRARRSATFIPVVSPSSGRPRSPSSWRGLRQATPSSCRPSIPSPSAAQLRIFEPATTAGDDTYALPAGGHAAARLEGPRHSAGIEGIQIQGRRERRERRRRPCIVKTKVIKGHRARRGVTLTPPFTGDIGIVLRLGDDGAHTVSGSAATRRGTTERNDAPERAGARRHVPETLAGPAVRPLRRRSRAPASSASGHTASPPRAPDRSRSPCRLRGARSAGTPGGPTSPRRRTAPQAGTHAGDRLRLADAVPGAGEGGAALDHAAAVAALAAPRRGSPRRSRGSVSWWRRARPSGTPWMEGRAPGARRGRGCAVGEREEQRQEADPVGDDVEAERVGQEARQEIVAGAHEPESFTRGSRAAARGRRRARARARRRAARRGVRGEERRGRGEHPRGEARGGAGAGEAASAARDRAERRRVARGSGRSVHVVRRRRPRAGGRAARSASTSSQPIMRGLRVAGARASGRGRRR